MGVDTVTAQHRWYLQTINDDRDPTQTFLEELESELRTWLEMGDHVIVGGDVNQNVLHQDIRELFKRNGMHNVLDTKHQLERAPATFMFGQDMIEGLWATHDIKIKRCGYFAPGKMSPGNHSLLWMDISYHSVLGHSPILPQTFKA